MLALKNILFGSVLLCYSAQGMLLRSVSRASGCLRGVALTLNGRQALKKYEEISNQLEETRLAHVKLLGRARKIEILEQEIRRLEKEKEKILHGLVNN